MKIAVVGCGITGTAVSCFLARAGYEVSIFEQASACRPVGAGILLQPSGQDVLQQLGALQQIRELSQPLDGLLALKQSGRELVRLKYDWLDVQLFGLGVHRGELFAVLLECCRTAGVQIHTNCKVVQSDVQESERWLETEQGQRFAEFDFVIGSDGSASQLRHASGIKCKTIEYDYAALWVSGDCDYQPDSLVQIVDGTHKLAGLLPIGGGRSSFFWGLPADQYSTLKESSIDDWKKEVSNLCLQSNSLLSQINGFSDLTFARYRHVTMRHWVTDRMIFLGDAAHATSPHLGQGVNLGLEDAACFSEAIRETSNFEVACQRYTKQRRAKLRYYSSVTKLLTPFFQAKGRARGLLRDVFLPWFPYTPFVRREMIRTLCGHKNGWLS